MRDDGVKVQAADNLIDGVRRRWIAGALFPLTLLAVRGIEAQEVRSLSLSEAVEIAVRNNPVYLSRANDQAAADWQAREAYGSLLPSLNANANAAYTEAGVQRIGTLDFGAQSTDWYSSNYGLSLNWTLDGNTLFGIPSARANQDATEAGIQWEEFRLEQTVTLQYMAALRARDAVRVSREQLERAEQNLQIVRSRVSSGAAAGVEATQAEVTRGRAEVALLRAERDARAELLRLQEQLGVTVGTEEVELVSEFEIFEPAWQTDDLIAWAMASHPSLRSARATEASQQAQVRQAWSQYLPTLNLTTTLSGNALQALNEDFVVSSVEESFNSQLGNCQRLNAIDAGIAGGLPNYQQQDCSQFIYSDAIGQQALAANDVFPFDFTRNPVTLRLGVSLPIFTGFSRQRQLEQAEAQAQDAAYDLRAEELRLRTAVTQALYDVRASHQSVAIEERNLELAQAQLETARQRYAVGATSILDLQDAETSLSTAERDYLDARYNFHQSLVVLEAATGRTLRPRGIDGNSSVDRDVTGG
ncbi:MAG: TolC family protein [Gemmatimonadota bacterium]